VSTPAPPTPTGRSAAWERLHPLSPVVRGGRAAAALVVFLVIASVQRQQGDGTHVAIDAVLVGAALVLGLVHWLVTRWSFDGETLRVETGLLRRDARTVPVARIQAVDLIEPFVAKFLDVAELRIRVAGSGKDERLAYLHRQRATTLRAALLATHHGLDASTPEPPELPLAVVSTGRLASSVALSPSSLLLFVILIALAGIFVASERAGAAFGAAIAAYLLSLVTVTWRRFNGQYGFTVASAPDGIRVRRGLLGTVAETVPARRVQAVRRVEPVLWQPFGWCRLDVDLAGIVPRETSGGPREMTRTLLPVADAAVADSVRASLVDDRGVVSTRPPRRALLKSPLSYHNLLAGHDDRVAVAVTGRLRRETWWVLLEKVQSVRCVQGPVQRRLGLASVHLDVAGRRAGASFRDRDATEAHGLVDELVERCRGARGAAPPASR